MFLGDIPGEAIGVSSDGSQIVGQAADSTGNGRAFYYTNSGGLIDLGVLSNNSFDQSVAIGVSDNSIVIGASINTKVWTSQPFLWTPKIKRRRLQPTLVRSGARIPSSVTLTTVLAISADVSTIAGLWADTKHQGVWLARLHGTHPLR